MNEKKVIVFIVEGPSDEAALGSIMKESFSSEEVQFAVVHGDITLKDYVSMNTILEKINEQLEIVKKKYRYEWSDIVKVIHLVDMDGVYVQKEYVKYAKVDSIRYFEDHIETAYLDATVERNKKKGEVLYKLRKTGKVHDITYRIYYNSCNLEHVLYGELKDFSDEEKQEMSDDFAEQYDGRAYEFLEFISTPEMAVQGTYQKTWDFIEMGRNSLNRYSNMHLMFQ